MKFIILRPEFRPTDECTLNSPTVVARQVSVEPKLPPKHQTENNYKQMQPKSSKMVVLSPSVIEQQHNSHSIRSPPMQHQQSYQQPMTRQQPPPVPLHQRTMSGPVSQSDAEQQQHQQYHQHSPSQSNSIPSQSSSQYQISLTEQQRFNQQRSTQHNQYQQQRSLPPSLPTSQRPLQPVQQNTNPDKTSHDVNDSSFTMPLPLPPQNQSSSRRSQLTNMRPESLNLSSSSQMPPPRPPPRRRQSTASLFKPSPSKPIEKSREAFELARKSLAGRVREHALRLNSSASSSDFSALMPRRNSSMKENRLSRDSSAFGSIASALQRNGSHITNRSRSSHREDESDSSSLQPIDPLRRKWALEACNCNYNGLMTLLRDDPKLASCKDMVNGYTALHWAAKFGNLDIIKLMAGTHSVSANIKSSSGQTPLHIAYMFNRPEAVNLLLKSYNANPDIRDHSGKRPMQYWQKPNINNNNNQQIVSTS